MPSPFPGMDPYLEDPGFWPGVHSGMNYNMVVALNPQLPEGYFAQLDEYIWLEDEANDERELIGKPDVTVLTGGGRAKRAPSDRSVVLVAVEPTTRTTLFRTKHKKTRRYVKIVDKNNRRVVTAIELLSPSNKTAGDGRTKYLAKRSEYLGSDINLVEIDLLRDGDRMPFGRPKPPIADYYVLIAKANNASQTAVWALSVRDPLPAIPIPIVPKVPDVLLSLQQCLNRVYDDINYGPQLRYDRPPDPPLRKGDAEWAVELLKPVLQPKKKAKSP